MIIYHLTIFFMAQIIVLDYSDASVHIYHDADVWWDIEGFLFSREGFRESEIEWMSASSLTYHHHRDDTNETVFRIDTEELEEISGRTISWDDIKKILSYIENDEGIWDAIEQAKRDAISSVLGN